MVIESESKKVDSPYDEAAHRLQSDVGQNAEGWETLTTGKNAPKKIIDNY